MTFEQKKKELLAYVAKNKWALLIKSLKESVKPELDRSAYLGLLNISRRYNQLMDAKMTGILEYSQEVIEQNKISNAVVHLIKNLEPVDLLLTEAFAESKVENKLLVLTNSSAAKESLRDFFEATNFAEVKIVLYDTIPTLANYDLIIFDNRDLVNCPHPSVLDKLKPTDRQAILDRVVLMDDLKTKTTCFFIHFGEFLYWVAANRARVHAANSTFSLFARTKEMTDFINTYRV